MENLVRDRDGKVITSSKGLHLETGIIKQSYVYTKPISFKLRQSRSKYINKIIETTNGDYIKVLASLDIKDKNNLYYLFLVEFIESGLQIVVSIDSLKSKIITNPYSPSVFNIGYLGLGKYPVRVDGTKTKEYNTWKGMLGRCYDNNTQERQPTYKDCTVDSRWHNFQNFCEDIQTLEGYKEWKENKIPHAWALDKDIKVEGNKIYSKDTCMFVTANDNVLKASLKEETYLAENIVTGEKIIFKNIRKFSREHNNIDRGYIKDCLRGKRVSYKNYIFTRLA